MLPLLLSCLTKEKTKVSNFKEVGEHGTQINGNPRFRLTVYPEAMQFGPILPHFHPAHILSPKDKASLYS